MLQIVSALHFNLDGAPSTDNNSFNAIYNKINTDPAFSSYFNDARLLHSIPGENWGALIASRWFCGAAHVVTMRETNNEPNSLKLFYNEDRSWVDLRHQMKFRNPKVDLGLLYLRSDAKNGINNATVTPVPRYPSSSSPQGEVYLYADLWHSPGGGSLGRTIHKGLYTKCNYPDANYSPEIWKQIPLVNPHPRLKVQSFQGDSSSGAYKKVGNQFQLFGIDAGNTADGNGIYIIPTSHPEIEAWINDCINSVAQGTLPNYYLDVRPDFVKDYFSTQGSPYSPKDLEIIRYRQKLAVACQIPVQDGLIVIDPYLVVALPGILTEGQPVNIRMFTFLDDADVVNSINRQIYPGDDTYQIESAIVKRVYKYKSPNQSYSLELGRLDRPMIRKIVKRHPQNIETIVAPLKRYRGSHPFAQNDYIVKTTSGANVNIQGNTIPYNAYSSLGTYKDAYGRYQFAGRAQSDNSFISLTANTDPFSSRYNSAPINGVVLSRKNASTQPSDFDTAYGFVNQGDANNITFINIGAGASGAAVDKMILQDALNIKPAISGYNFYQHQGIVIIDPSWAVTLPHENIASINLNTTQTINSDGFLNLVRLSHPMQIQAYNRYNPPNDPQFSLDPIFERMSYPKQKARIDKIILHETLLL